jgi:hypothetical protein
MVLYPLAAQVPGNVVRRLVHNHGYITTAVAHVLAALHTDPIKGRSAPCVDTPTMLNHGGARHFVMLACHLHKRPALPDAEMIVIPAGPFIFPTIDRLLVRVQAHGTKIPRATSPVFLL